MNMQQIITRFSLCLLAWCTLAVAPTFAQTITHVPLFTFDGDSAGDRFGISVSGAGDVNGDGFADLIVGAPGDDNNAANSGSARVFSGVDGSVLYNFFGDSAWDLFGFSVSGAGVRGMGDGFIENSGADDVNGDGIADLIVGVPGDDSHGEDNGSVRVLSGIDGGVLHNFFGAIISGVDDPTS